LDKDAPRPTRDLDLLGRGDPSHEHCKDVFKALCKIPVIDDGLIFFSETMAAEKIKEEQEYEGIRVRLRVGLENARIPVQIDIGFGDAVTADVLDYPTLLSMPAARIQAYPMETVLAEKLEAIVSLGMLNSRMKTSLIYGSCREHFRLTGKLFASLLPPIRRLRKRSGATTTGAPTWKIALPS
jgi:hypothetical protein